MRSNQVTCSSYFSFDLVNLNFIAFKTYSVSHTLIFLCQCEPEVSFHDPPPLSGLEFREDFTLTYFPTTLSNTPQGVESTSSTLPPPQTPRINVSPTHAQSTVPSYPTLIYSIIRSSSLN
jgi:hypothetical protein